MNWLTPCASATPHKLALIMGEQRWTYAGLNALVDRLAIQLSDEIQPGQIVAVLMPNSLAYVCLIHAIAQLEAVLLPLNTRLTEAELAWQLADAQCGLLLVDASFQEMGMRLVQAESCGLAVVDDRLSIERHIESGSAVADAPLPPHAAIHAIVYTSGTTGKPKGAMLTFDNHYHSAMASAERIGIDPDDIWLSCLPLYHVGGLAVIWRSCLYATAVSLHQRFILEAVNRDLDTNPITLISVVPTMLQRLLASRTSWPGSLRLILLGGAAATAELIEQANRLPRSGKGFKNGLPLVATTYGLTEAASQVATLLPADVVAKPGSVGKPLPGMRVRIVDDLGRDQPANTPGEIVVAGPTVMAGYFRRPDATAETVRNNELYTGDIGTIDDDGDLWLVQRRSDIILSGGENVYPAEVEAVLRQHPAVVEVCVVGTVDAEWGQSVAAMVVTAGDGVSAEALTAFARQRLAGYKLPRRWQFVAALPLTASGKIARKQVQNSFANAA